MELGSSPPQDPMLESGSTSSQVQCWNWVPPPGCHVMPCTSDIRDRHPWQCDINQTPKRVPGAALQCCTHSHQIGCPQSPKPTFSSHNHNHFHSNYCAPSVGSPCEERVKPGVRALLSHRSNLSPSLPPSFDSPSTNVAGISAKPGHLLSHASSDVWLGPSAAHVKLHLAHLTSEFSLPFQ
jgi:hypothetical protein